MKQSKSYSWAAITAGILFVLMALLQLLAETSIGVLGLSVGYLVIAIALFIRKRNALIIVGAIIASVATAYLTFNTFIILIRYQGMRVYNLYNIVNAVLNLTNIAGLVVFTVIAAKSKTPEKRVKLKNIWFLPAVLVIVSDVLMPVLRFVLGWGYGYGMAPIYSIATLIGYVIVFVAFLLAGMWLCLGYDKVAANPAFNYAPAAAPQYAPAGTPVYAPPAAAPASVPEELKIYIDLVNSGVITIEEYEAKKKQLMGQ